MANFSLVVNQIKCFQINIISIKIVVLDLLKFIYQVVVYWTFFPFNKKKHTQNCKKDCKNI